MLILSSLYLSACIVILFTFPKGSGCLTIMAITAAMIITALNIPGPQFPH